MRYWFLPLAMLVLSLLSLLTLRSVSPSLAAPQLIFFFLGFIIFFAVSKIPYAEIENWRWLAYAGLIALLIVPLAIGKTTRGIAGWIDIGTLFSIQPSQLAVMGAGLVLCHRLVKQPPSTWKNLLLSLVIIMLPAGLIIIEPDLGTTLVYLASMAAVLFVSPLPWKYIAMLSVAAVATAVIGWQFLKPYQKARITSFLDSDTTQDANYNAQQALIAVGSGQIVGRGIGQGVQSHLRFLPERQTDFIFASLAEEMGFIGSVVVVCLYCGIVLFIIRVAVRTKHPSQRYFCLAAATMTGVQAGINMGMNMGLLPITGVTLPLLSYGGSSILTVCALYGLIQSINTASQQPQILHIS